MDLDIAQLPPKQRQVLDALAQFTQANGYAPSIQQLCALCGVSSTSTIHYHLTTLKRKGFIKGNPSEKRAISLDESLVNRRGQLPICGVIAAGTPLQVENDNVEHLDLATDLCPPDCYLLKVKGDSMIEDHILDGDWVVINPQAPVREGDVAVALVEGEMTTLKRIYIETDGQYRLQPANATMAPIYAKQVDIQGKVEAVLRRFQG